MPKEDKVKLAIELIKFFLYIVTLIISIAFAFNSMEKRISIIESEIPRVSVPPLSGKVKK